MSSNKSYLVSDLAAELNIPRTTVNDWLKIYGPYLESELRGKRKVYPERSLRILQEIKTMRDNGASPGTIEQDLAERYGIRPEPVLPIAEAATEEAAAENTQSQPQTSAEALVRPDPELKELFQRMLEQDRERQNAVRRSARRFMTVFLLLLLFLAAGLVLTAWHFSLKLAKAESLAAQRQHTADQAIAAAAQHLTEIRKLQENAREESARHASQLEKMAVTLDRTRQDYQQEAAKLNRELAENKKAADAALQAMRKDESTRREAEIAELKRAFAASQKTLLTQYETERAARLEAEAGKASMESELTELRKQKQAQQQIVPVTSSPAEPAAPAAKQKGDRHD